MTRTFKAMALIAAASGSSALAQAGGPPMGWTGSVDGFIASQGDADLQNGGSFSAQRAYVRAGGLYRYDSGHSAGVFVSAGTLNYDFDVGGSRPWGDITDLRISVPLRFEASDQVSVFVVPSLRYDYESGVSASEGETFGAIAGVTWRVSDRLTIGPGLGVFTQLEDDDLNVFPALLIDWKISDKWSFSTGRGLGATQGPGLSLSYEYSNALRFSVGARYEELRFRLDDQGLAPGGIGQDKSLPVALALDYNPSPFLSLSAFAGAELNGELQLETAGGAVVSSQEYDTAPIFGFAFRVLF
jgi:hypothetical protein